MTNYDEPHTIPSVGRLHTWSEDGSEKYFVSLVGSEFVLRLDPDDAEALAGKIIDTVRIIGNQGRRLTLPERIWQGFMDLIGAL